MIPIEHLIILVLSHKTRLDIVNLLAGGPKTLKEISAILLLGQPLVRYHLKVLQRAGLIGKSDIHGGRGQPKASYHMASGLPSLTSAQKGFLESAEDLLDSFVAQERRDGDVAASSVSVETRPWWRTAYRVAQERH